MSSTEMQSVVTMVSVAALTGHPSNAREMASQGAQDGLQDLAQSIKSLGVLEPVLARPVDGGGFQILAGHRRVAAAILAGVDRVPVIARSMSDAQALEVLVTENLQREDLSPMEEAAGVASLMDLAGWKARDVADRLGKSTAWVSQRSRLFQLSPWWKQKAADPKSIISQFPVGHLLLISRLEPEVQEELGKVKYGKMNWLPDPREIEHTVATLAKKLTLAPWKLADDGLFPEAGACSACRKRSGCHPGLFEEDEGAKNPAKQDRCLDAKCWEEKWKRFRTAKETDLRAKYPNLILVKGDGDYAAQPGVFSASDYEAGKKGDEGAVPALVVGGKGAGALKWVVLARSRPSNVPKSERPKGANGNPAPMPLAQRRMDLERRRRARGVELLIAQLGPESVPDMTALLKLVAVFGTWHKRDTTYGGYWPVGSATEPASMDGEQVESWDAYLSMTPSQVSAQLWNSVAWVLKKRLAYHPQCDMRKLWAEAEQVARVVRVSMEDMFTAACEAIPIPKSWAGLNEDGTPKAAGDAKPKATAPKASDPEAGGQRGGEYETGDDDEAES